MRGPHGIDLPEIMEALLAVVRTAQDFEDENEAWDMAPPASRPSYDDVGAAFSALQDDFAKLRQILSKASDSYSGSMERITHQSSDGEPSSPTRISQRRRT